MSENLKNTTERTDLLFEIGTEEIPAGFLTWGIEEINKVASEEFASHRIEHFGIHVCGTPRRLALYARGVADYQTDLVESAKGPLWEGAFDANENPTKAAMGFAKSKNVSVDTLIKQELGGVNYAFAVITHRGGQTFELLPGILSRIIKRLVFPKNMYWDDPSVRFARPVRWLVALFGDKVIPISLGKIQSGRVTRGHRFLGKKHLEIPEAKQYMNKLYDEFVIADQNKRKEKMLSGIASIQKELDLNADIMPDLVEENVNLVEYPFPFYGSFDASYLDIPEEVLVTSMKKHQRYFPVRDKEGNLQAYFIGVSNNQAARMQTVREGNERVLRARLSDAAFFWQEDQKTPLIEKTEGLKSVIYQEKLGSVYEKTQRARKLAHFLAEKTDEQQISALLDRAALISKADLVTSMVFEFTELQGVMGREYAKKNGEDPRVALAVFEQYMPKFAGDKLPTDIIGAILGLADRADTLIAIHHAGLEPSGSQDPYALRRAARCINELIWGLELDIDVYEMLDEAAKPLDASNETVTKVKEFYKQRQTVQLREKNYSHGAVQLAMECIEARPLQTLRLLKVLENIKKEAWFAALVMSFVRVKNITAKTQTEKTPPREDLFVLEEEKELYGALCRLKPQIAHEVRECNWEALAKLLFELAPKIGNFFDKVLVMDEDKNLRVNRLNLLLDTKELFDNIGDFSYLKS